MHTNELNKALRLLKIAESIQREALAKVLGIVGAALLEIAVDSIRKG